MTFSRRFPAVAALITLGLAAPAAAQDYDYVENVAFFERVVVGGLEVTPFGIRRDTRCADIRFCTREDTLIVSLVLFDYRGKSEIDLEIGRPAAVPGGFLVLRSAGTTPAFRGAIPLRDYALDLEFIPLDEAFANLGN